jgi:predicted MFS family arabinose efflux permease
VGIGALLHFLVDGLCLCCLYLIAFPFSFPRLTGIFVVYNVLAFLTQPLTGLLADRMRERHWMLLAAVVLLLVAVMTVNFGLPFAGYLAPVLLGIGNSLFHVGGGKQVVLKAGNDMRALGLFVSTGAFGLAVAMVFFSLSLLYIFLLALCLLAVAYLKLEQNDERVGNAVQDTPWSSRVRQSRWLLLLVVVAFVMFRSFMGESFTSAIVKDNMVVLLVGMTAMLGKMAGGWLANRMGILVTLAAVAVVVSGCLLCRSSERYVMLTGLFAVNCTMPVTLYWANGLLKGREGLAFGLLAAALIPGYLLTTLVKI